MPVGNIHYALSRCCVALCEVAQGNMIKLVHNPSNIDQYHWEHVALDEDDVIVRCFIIYDASFVGAAFKYDRRPRLVNIQADELWKALQKTSEYQRMSRAIYGVSM